MIFIKNRIIIATIFILVAVGLFLSHQEKYHSRTIYGAFDTSSEITVYSSKDNTESYEKILRTYHSQLDIHSENSLISRLNKGEKVTLTPDITELLEKSAYYSDTLSDYFDITINPVLESWENAENDSFMPSTIEEKLELVGIDSLHIDTKTNTAELVKNDASITLGAIAKGFATERLLIEMKKDGTESGLINLGGNVYALGKKSNGKDWQIAVADPKNSASSLLSLNVSDAAVVTSGNYERFYEIGENKYNHIIDPKTGYPVQNELSSVTVIGTDNILCDVLSTAVFVAGKDEARNIAQSFGVDIILICSDSIYYTSRLKDKITLHSSEYKLYQL